jgi:hypothetical protein
MAQRDDLHDLIHTLSASEKRYFKLHAGKYTSDTYKSQYVKLFDALNKWDAESFDEAAFKKKNRAKTFTKNLAFEKSHLYDVLLKTLRNYHTQTDPLLELQEMIGQIHLLYQKGLKDQALRLLHKAEKLAEDAEQLHELLIIHDLSVKLYRLDPNHHKLQTKSIQENGQDILLRITLTQQAILLRVQIYEIYSNKQWDIESDRIDGIMREVELLETHANLTRRAKLNLLNTRQFYLINLHRYEECLDITSRWLDNTPIDKSHTKYFSEQYFAMWGNYLLCAFHAERYEVVLGTIAKIKEFPVRTEQEAADSFRIGTQYELMYLLNSSEISDIDMMTANITSGLLRFRELISIRQLVNFRFNLCVLFYLNNRYDDAMTHIRELYSVCGRDNKYEVHIAQARVMEWICQSTMGQTRVLYDLLRNLKLYFKERGFTGAYITAVFELFTQIEKGADVQSAPMLAKKKKILSTPVPKDWTQLEGIVSHWIGE